MKRILVFTISFVVLLIACDEIPDNVVNSKSSEYTVSNLTAPDNLTFRVLDSSFVASITIDNKDVVASVWYDILSANASRAIISHVAMFDNGDRLNYGDESAGDNIFTGKTFLGVTKASGEYLVEFFVEDNVNNDQENTRKVGVHKFTFDNGQNKVAPVISNLVMADSVNKGVRFIFTLDVSDGNGYENIDRVFFDLYRPDGSLSGTASMFDDGGIDQNSGDLVAKDGTFSFANSFDDLPGSPLQLGNWRFEFQAVDLGGLVSNKITHIIKVKE